MATIASFKSDIMQHDDNLENNGSNKSNLEG